MGVQVTLTVPDIIYQQAKEIAQINNSQIEDILALFTHIAANSYLGRPTCYAT